MKILIFSPTAPPFVSGLSLRISNLVKHLRLRNEEVVYVSYFNGLMDDQDYKITMIDSFSTSWIYPNFRQSKFYKLKTWRSFMRLLGDFNPDVVHCVDVGLEKFVFSYYCRKNNKPLVLGHHTNIFRMPRNKCIRYIQNCLIRPFMKSQLNKPFSFGVGISKSFCEVLRDEHNINLPFFSPPCSSSDVFLPIAKGLKQKTTHCDVHRSDYIVIYAGRIAAEKNLLDLLKIIDGVANLTLVILGTGPLKLQKLPNNCVRIDKFVSQKELRSIYSECDATISFSDFEGIASATIDGLACGLPAIAPKAPGFVDYIIDRKNGIFLDINDLDLSRKALQSLVADTELQHQLKQYCMANYKQFCFKGYVDYYQTLYKRAVFETSKSFLKDIQH